jgi:hypothetical protein
MIPALLLAAVAHATTFSQALTLPELAERSDHALSGTIVSVEGVLRAGKIWTLARVRADEGPDTDVWVMGGCMPERDLCMTVAGSPQPQQGEKVFVFLSEGRLTGLSQGFFRVDGGRGVRDLSGLTFLDGAQPPTSLTIDELRAAAATVKKK